MSARSWDGQSRKILVIGAGELGMPVLRNVVRRAADVPGSSVDVLLRSNTIDSTVPAKQRDVAEIRQLGIGIIRGDLVESTIDDLAAIFADYDTVIGCTGITAGLDTPMKVAQAALRAGIPRYFPWQFGVDFDVIGRGSPQDIFDSQLDVRDLLRSQHDTEWVIVSTGMFMNYLFDAGSGMVDLPNDTVNALGTADTAVTVTTPEDIGALTAEILFTQPRIADEIVYVAGDTITYGQLAETLEAVLDRPFELRVWSEPRLMTELAADPDNMTRKYRAVFAQGRGVAWDKDDTFNARQAIPTTTLRAWIGDNITA
ncbi:aromatic alcohol reductase [Curtobacterium flaccumfaciens pv. oortii]|uniref:aromatic alcohol reductase n=1 Tax=Curtobacterium flaccumfaciens TaxID=2035 RepID=UPI00265B2F99|nr:aromatic alcohol reductase [Curtobacterium flaccumfaciens]MCS5521807.1 aromatic alcohol reductase [Curtobacterium flaccumfaciens pv. oortii]